ncbi:ABC transporter permease [Burkholderia multivorans]|uniref:ABC transporter permease n=1 Tax=Burkholderia multivorans TaxID=87883 RepID=UPI000566E7C5|nr:ABC transporter permease [Burkholderia multivorans]AVR21321.1 ABC transporter permease [Burkholderia multivorans]MCO1434719.1 ABC transporter permease [Burkholderia multivorans]UQN59872.1 ABC transporter permease [Burkholderia multivorans]UQN66812.1 ABC transporter permease [Burkholderia multivorans]UQO05689.1 ABC transporter permease [Burkholderia multivorans]
MQTKSVSASSANSSFPLSPWSMVASIKHHRHLIWQMTKREVIGRYQGSVMGILWSFLNPLCMLIVYTFVFSVVFKSHWGQDTSDNKTAFALILFSGLIVFSVFSEAIGKAPGLVTANVNYVKKVVFPLEVLPIVSLAAVAFHMLVSVLILLIAFGLFNGYLYWSVILFPLVLVPLALFVLGVSWFLASLGVFLRDVQQTITLAITVIMFVTPIFYPITALPERYQVYLRLNPMAFFVDQARRVLVFGLMPQWTALAAATILGAGVAWLGYVWFQKTRVGFADVL